MKETYTLAALLIMMFCTPQHKEYYVPGPVIVTDSFEVALDATDSMLDIAESAIDSMVEAKHSQIQRRKRHARQEPKLDDAATRALRGSPGY